MKTIPFQLFVLIISLFATFTSSGQIIYTDVNPDSVISASSQPGLARYDIDLNNDNSIDFYLKHFHQPNNIVVTEFYTMIGQEGEVLVDGNAGPYALDDIDTIHASNTNWINKAGQSSSVALPMNENWVGKQDKFVGLRFKISGQWHYGWIRLSVPSDTSSIIVNDYAYNSIANDQIITGQISTGTAKFIEFKTFSVYPNPNNGNFNIDLKQFVEGEIQVVDLSGSVVHSEIVNGNKLTLQTDLPAGVYFVRIHTKSLIFNSKIILE